MHSVLAIRTYVGLMYSMHLHPNSSGAIYIFIVYIQAIDIMCK